MDARRLAQQSCAVQLPPAKRGEPGDVEEPIQTFETTRPCTAGPQSCADCFDQDLPGFSPTGVCTTCKLTGKGDRQGGPARGTGFIAPLLPTLTASWKQAMAIPTQWWDNSDMPSVETPIGDFFAAGKGMRADVNSLPIQVTSYGRAFNSYWRMHTQQEDRWFAAGI